MNIIGKKVSFSYGQKKVLEDIDFQIKQGKFTCLLGTNGCGKTTLIGLISGTHHLKEGEIIIDGTSVRNISAREMAKFLAVVPQFNMINFPFTSLEVVMMGRYPFKERFSRFSEEDIEICLKCMIITDTIQFARRPVNTLSGGERQRVILARALAQQPKILILDEATSNLDIRHTMSFMAIIKKLSQFDNITVISAMHDLNLAATFCDEVILMKDRKIHAMGTVNEVFSQENIVAVYNTPVSIERKNGNCLSIYLKVPEIDKLYLL